MQIPFVDLKAQYQTIKDEIADAITNTLDGMDLVLGPNVRAFEAEFATYCGTQHAVGVASGTDALCLALRACGIRPGDEVITVSHTFVATAEAIVQLGAVPVFVDVDPDTYTLDPACLKAAITSRTRAIVPVHLYGQMADMDAIMCIAERHGLMVVEDACQAHGADLRGRRAGSIGDSAAFSFHIWSNLGAFGDAGAVTTNSRAVAEQVRVLRDHGASVKFQHQETGVNSHLDELQAAVLRVKLRRLNAWNALRRAHARTYAQQLADTALEVPLVRPGSTHVYNTFVVRTDDRDRVRKYLEDRGVTTDIHYPIPVHRQVGYRGIGQVAGDLRVTEAVSKRILSLPMYAELEPEQLGYISACLRECNISRRKVRC